MSNRRAKRGPQTNRREFVSRAALAAATATIVPRHVLGRAGRPSANEKLNIAGVGVGGMGKNNLAKCAGENIVALCDLDSAHAAKTFSTYPGAKTYKDFRVMLDRQRDIDAVKWSTDFRRLSWVMPQPRIISTRPEVSWQISIYGI